MTRDELLELIDTAVREGWTELDLSNQEITELPPEIGKLANLEKLHLYNNQLKSLPKNIRWLENLNFLDISGNDIDLDDVNILVRQWVINHDQLHKMLVDIFDGIFGLDLFNDNSIIDVNLIQEFSWEISASIQQLNPFIVYVRLDSKNIAPILLFLYDIESFPEEIIGISSLQLLFLWGNFTNIPQRIGQLSNLKCLFLLSDQLNNIPGKISQLSNLESLIIVSDQLTELPSEIGQLSNLETLMIATSQPLEIPTEIDNLTNLKNLSIQSENINYLIPNILSLNNLQKLDLDDNHLTELPKEIVQLTNLNTLNLSNNKLSTLPTEFGQLTKLESLNLTDNQITELPNEIGRLSNLRELNLSNNKLSTLPTEFGQLTKLESLNLTDNQITELPNEIGRLSNLRELNLYKNKLSTLPTEFGQLTKLGSLNLTKNQITKLPNEIGRLSNLRELNLSNNKLSTLPTEFGQLTKLESLNLTDNQITELPNEIGRLSNLRELNLYKNKLSTLPTEFGQLTKLESLNLADNQIIELPNEIGQLSNLQELNLYNNKLSTLPTEFSQLTSLHTLHLSRNQITELPNEICLLSSLQELNLSDNKLSTLTAEFGQLTSLHTLHLSRNQITELPNEIGQLSNLQELNLSHNKLSALPAEIGQLINLESLYANDNKSWKFEFPSFTSLLTKIIFKKQSSQNNNDVPLSIPNEIKQLINLKELDLSRNKLTNIPEEVFELSQLRSLKLNFNLLTEISSNLGKLTNIKSLDLSYNQLIELPNEIDQLSNLNTLNLSRNQITELPNEIGQLSNLQKLNLSENKLSTLPAEIGQLINLESLNLTDNQITTLPYAITRIEELNELLTDGNPLPIPPELLNGRDGTSNIQLVFDTLFRESHPLCEAKLLLVGEGSVGKTSLIERLLWDSPPSNHGKTIGVEIHDWLITLQTSTSNNSQLSKSELHLKVWDFGGQEIYHATHQFFLTHRSLYLLVLDARRDEAANRLDYWLRHIQSFAGDSPLIIVVNKNDEAQPVFDKRGLKLKHPSIQDIVYTSCITGDGILELRNNIEQALNTIPHLNDLLPRNWYSVKNKLTDIAKEMDTLPYESYLELCLAEGIEQEGDQRTLVRLLHDLGTVLNFHNDRRLAGTQVLNPDWVTGGIYKILNDEKLQGHGVLNINDLDEKLDPVRYPPHKHHFLLDIMEKFELCVAIGDHKQFLIPGLLQKERPSFRWPQKAGTILEYHYSILPTSVLSRLMVRLHLHTWHNIRWRHGVILALDNCRSLIIVDPNTSCLSIALDGSGINRQRLLAIIRSQLDEIHASFAQLEAEEWVPIPNKKDASIPFQALLNLEAKGITTYYDAINDVEFEVTAVLDGIEAADERAARPLRQKMIEHFNMDELRTLCLDLGVDIETWPDQGKPALVRNLVLHFLKQDRLVILEEAIRKERPFL